MQSYCMFGCVELTEFWMFPQYNMPVLCGVKILHVLQLWTWRQFCFCDKAFLLMPCVIVSLTGYQRFVSSWTSCVCFAGLIRFCSITNIISLEFLLGHWRGDINCHRWNLNLWCSSFFDLWITISGIFQCTELFAVSLKIIIADWNFYILCLDIKRLLQWKSSWTGYISAAKIR